MTRTALQTSLVVALTFVVYGALPDGAALARTQLYSPFGASAPVTAFVGGCSSGLCQIVVWQRNSDSACAITLIGDGGGLFDNTEINGGSGNDTLYIMDSSNAYGPLCGYNLTYPIYNGYYLDLYGQGGSDDLRSHTGGDSWLFGGDGNDVVFSVGPGNLWGGNGNDIVYARGAFSAEGLFGEAGNDCLEDENAAAATIDCGPGTDNIGRALSGAIPLNFNCEQIVGFCF